MTISNGGVSCRCRMESGAIDLPVHLSKTDDNSARDGVRSSWRHLRRSQCVRHPVFEKGKTIPPVGAEDGRRDRPQRSRWLMSYFRKGKYFRSFHTAPYNIIREVSYWHIQIHTHTIKGMRRNGGIFWSDRVIILMCGVYEDVSKHSVRIDKLCQSCQIIPQRRS